jgi:hypothetical protein
MNMDNLILFANERTPGDRVLVIGNFNENIKMLFGFCEIYFVDNTWSTGIDVTVCGNVLPFENGSFDYLVNQCNFDESECLRVLKKNKGYYKCPKENFH